jgi:hypothetical protein
MSGLEELLVRAAVGALAFGGITNVLRSLVEYRGYAARLRDGIEERRQALPQHPAALTEGIPGERIVVLGCLHVDAGCDPFVPLTHLTSLAPTPTQTIAVSAREADGRQEIRTGGNPRLVTEGREVALVADEHDPWARTRLVLGTRQVQVVERGSTGRVTATYLSLEDDDQVWVVGTLVREVDDEAPQASYRGEPVMRYTLAAPHDIFAIGEAEVAFRRQSVGATDVIFAIAGAIIAVVFTGVI